jgi:hypothetical protein
LAPTLTPTKPRRGRSRSRGRAAAILRQPEQARTRIARLRPRRDAADLDQAETDIEQRVRYLGVLVEARREADRIGQAPAPDFDAEDRRVGLAVARHQPALQRTHGEPVGGFSLEAREDQIEQRVPDGHAV